MWIDCGYNQTFPIKYFTIMRKLSFAGSARIVSALSLQLTQMLSKGRLSCRWASISTWCRVGGAEPAPRVSSRWRSWQASSSPTSWLGPHWTGLLASRTPESEPLFQSRHPLSTEHRWLLTQVSRWQSTSWGRLSQTWCKCGSSSWSFPLRDQDASALSVKGTDHPGLPGTKRFPGMWFF